ncbi:Fanconi anemia group E protein [Periophthalmus magnuspinnatus]|uniref:Fanconi anemia group E protein n=1 Tax=Periophthalmus magnuspinnatus TaxID=409849 RepID=UPI00145A96B6|nr:Fanconi anemia group E protein [Periophthalmus magnuspinnatus]
MLVERFEGPEKLLVQALLSGIHGVHRALEVFRKQQRANSGTSLDHFIQGFCKDEVTCAPGPEKGPLFTKPLVCLFPRLFQQNLLEFVYHLHHVLPQSTLRHLLDCIKQDCPPNSWVSSLVTQLERQLGIDQEKPLFSAQCGQRLTKLIHQLPRSDEAGGWASCFNLPLSSAPHSGPALPGVVSQRKRKSSDIYQDLDSEETSQNKRMRGNICADEDVGTQQELSKKEDAPDALISSEPIDPPPDVPRDALPENIKVAVLQLKDLIESNSEWDQSSSDVVKVLNDCDPAQLEVVCSTINLPKIPEHILPKLCSSVLALSPDLSFSTATTFIRNLLLEKILSLSEPASRCLVTTVTSLCSRYPRPMCHALFEHVLEDRNIGNLQADLLNKLVESCLDSHYKLQTLQMTFKVQWNEAVLSIIHCLLDSKLDISEELFTQFTEQLMSQASAFTKSVKFAKMLLTVLTKYNSSITATHKHTLSNCLMLNDTFLKKSLQAALKRITHT